jgi:hypothetical protein
MASQVEPRETRAFLAAPGSYGSYSRSCTVNSAPSFSYFRFEKEERTARTAIRPKTQPLSMADWLVLICQHPPQPPCQTPSPPRSCPSPPSRLPFRAEPPMTTIRSLTVCPGLAASCAGAIDASRVRLVAGLARGRGPGGAVALRQGAPRAPRAVLTVCPSREV